MNRAAFFAAVRSDPFDGALTSSQVSGMEAILDEWEHRGLTDLRWLAYMLGTVFHECARKMEPITEYGPQSYFKKYDGRADLGNTVPGDGARFKGRGFVQITGRRNYTRASHEVGTDLVANPERALEPTLAAAIMFLGMTQGWFTGKKLADYFHEGSADWINARRIINGTDKAQTIAKYANAFWDALLAARTVPDSAAPVQPPKPVPAPPPSSTYPPAPAGFWESVALLLKAIVGAFSRKR